MADNNRYKAVKRTALSECCAMDFNQWVRETINTQATPNGNSVSVDDFSKDGNSEYHYPIQFVVNGDEYRERLLMVVRRSQQAI